MEFINKKSMDNLKYNSDKLLGKKDGDWNKVLAHYKISEDYEKDCIEKLRHWYIHQHHLPQIELDDHFFARHLANRAYSIESTKELIDNYFTSRLMVPEIMQNRDPLSEEVIKAFQYHILCPLPKLTPEGHRVMLIRKLSPEWDLVATVKACMMIAEYRLKNDTMLGDHWIIDLEPSTVSDIFQITPIWIHKIVLIVTACIGHKLKGLHFVKIPPYGAPVLNLLKKTLKAKLAKRIHLYQNFDEVMKVFPKSMLPNDYGGDEPSGPEITEFWLKTLQTEPWRNWFIEQAKIVTDESKRLTKSTKFDDVFGVEGTFRNINID